MTKYLPVNCRFPVFFTLVNGHIKDFVAHKDDVVIVLNMKRAILTGLMTKTPRDEQDQEEV